MLSWLTSPSLELAETAEVACDVALILTTLVVVLGLIGEYMKGSWWKSKFPLFELMVVLGVAGEMFAEGGAFWYSSRARAADDITIARMATAAAPRDVLVSPGFALFAERLASPSVLVRSYATDAEGARLAEEVVAQLRNTGFAVADSSLSDLPQPPSVVFGVYVSGKNERLVSEIVDWLNESNLQAIARAAPISTVRLGGGEQFTMREAEVTVFIGSKPMEQFPK